MTPAISVILPVYNGGSYLRSSVESVLNQSLRNFELIIVDDCSTDESLSYLHTIKDDRVKLYQNEKNRGLFFNLNYLIGKSNGPLIKLWSQDDVMDSSALHEIVSFHAAHPTVGFSYTAVNYIDAESNEIAKPEKTDNTPQIINTAVHAQICFETGSIAGNIANATITKEALNKVGLFDEGMRMSGDFDMWVRIAEFFNVGFINKPLIALRDHAGQLSRQSKYSVDFIKEDIKVYKKLLNYLPKNEREKGRVIFRRKRLVYYYTLMLDALRKGRMRTAGVFFSSINEIDNAYLMFFHFIKTKFFYGRK